MPFDQNFVQGVERHYNASRYLDARDQAELQVQLVGYQYAPNDAARRAAVQNLGWALWNALESHFIDARVFQTQTDVRWTPQSVLIRQAPNDISLVDFQLIHAATHAVAPALGIRVHPAIYSRHDLYHGMRFLLEAPGIRRLIDTLYLAGRAVETLVSQSTIGRKFMGRLLDMEITATKADLGVLESFESMAHALDVHDLRFFELLYVQLGLRQWAADHRPQIVYIMKRLATVLGERARPETLLWVARNENERGAFLDLTEQERWELEMMVRLASARGYPAEQLQQLVHNRRWNLHQRTSVQGYLDLLRFDAMVK